jgi:capsular polysaccharide biosynthesis protein
MVGRYKPYKELFCKYLNVKDEDILYEVPEGSTCIIPPPLSLTCKGINELHRRLIKNILIPHNKIGTEFLIFPRNRYNNYEGNNTKLSYSELISFIDRTGIPYSVYDTSTTKELSSQINLVQQAKVLVIPDGSAFLVNGMFSSCTIYVVGRLCSLEQAKIFPQINYILDLILERNKVYWFSRQSDFIKFIQTGEYKEPTFIDRPNRTLECWW